MVHSKTIATMKSIFKSLMLVAVAATTFTACQKESVDLGKAEQKTVITFNAQIENTETRTYFGDYVENEGYPTLLSGNEVAKFNHWTTQNGNMENVVATVNDGSFTVAFYNTVAYGATIDAYLPASAWADPTGTWYDNYTSCVVASEYTIPAEQNPTPASVDEKAHIFKATTTYQSNDNIDLVFEHQVAYGKLSLANFDDTNVTQYVLTINGEIYVVNAEWTDNVWFACEPGAVTEMSISVVADKGTYTKQLAISEDNPLNFVKGQVSVFTVDMTGVNAGADVDTFNPDITLETLVYTSDSNGNMFKFTSSEFPYPNNDYVQIYLNEANYTSTSIEIGRYTGNGNGSQSNYNPAAGQFACKMTENYNTVFPKEFTSESTLEVSFTDGVYTIILTHKGKTYGYKGSPSGWEL